MRLNFRDGGAFATQKAIKYFKNSSPQEIKSIMVIRHAAIGDFMNIRPFLIHLRNFFPNAKITLNILHTNLYGAPTDLVDDVLVMYKADPNNSAKKTSFLNRVKQIRNIPEQDLLFDLTDSTFTLIVAIFSKVKIKIGYPYRSIKRFFYDVATLRSDFTLEAESVIQMLNILGCKSRDLQYGYENQYSKNNLKRIVYFAGASVKNKCWEEEKFKILIDRMSDKYLDYDHVILQGIKDDEKFLDIFESLKNKKNVILQQSMPLNEVMQFLSDSRCLISNDTGVRNMAIAVETQQLGYFLL
ncbi:MAG: glycosyltransferase family 9 protein [Sulfurimonas sp.]|jgi:ADP-heptose:LPS heptosyltransferase